MNYINITVRGKIARAEGRARVVCGNSDYTVRFDFDAEWAEYAVKTARFVSEDGSYTDAQFEGEDCAVPILRNTRTLLVGVFAGNLRTTTAALIHAVPCITDPDGTPADPAPDVYAQLMERFDKMEAPAAILYEKQDLTAEQKATARENIGVATPDWEQNDEDQPDYIKNRPFYEGVIETLLDPTIENWRNLVSGHDTLACSWRVAGVDYIDVIPSTYENGAVTQYKLGTVYVNVMSGQGRIIVDPSDADVHILKRESGVKQIDSKFLPLEQSDWEQRDETASDYIKNRPFYDDTVILPFASTPTTGAWEIAPTAADEFFNNISSYTVRYSGTDYHFDIFASMLWASVKFQGVGGKLSKNSNAFTSSDIPFVIYRVPNANGSYDGTSAYVGKSMSKPPEDIKIFRSNLKQLDPKFLPTNRFIVRVTQDGNGNFTADKTSAEIIEAYEAGKDVVASFLDTVLELPLYAISQGKSAVFDLSLPGETSQGLMIDDTGVHLSDALFIPKIYPDEKTSAMTNPVGVDGDGKLWSKADTSLNMTGATVGQIAKITAVDDSGKPTAWEAVDMPSGGGGETWEKIAEIVIPDGAEETNALTINKDIDGNSFALIKARLCVKQPKYTGSSNIPSFCFAMINGKVTGRIAPLAYTNAFCVPSKSLVTGTVYEVDVSGAQQIETVYRPGNVGWSDDTSSDYIAYGGTGVNFGKHIGDTLWAKPITSIGGTSMLIYPGCRFVLYGVRA